MIKLIISAILLVVIDSFYLYNVGDYFKNQIFLIQKAPLKLNLLSTLICYVFLIFGLYYFVLKDNKPIKDAFLFGVVVYMVFETTNKALFENWKWTTLLIDGIWGGILFAITTFLTYKIHKLIKKRM